MSLHGWEAHVVSHHPAKFREHRNCGPSRDMFLVVEGHINTPDIGHTHLEQQYKKTQEQLFPVRPDLL